MNFPVTKHSAVVATRSADPDERRQAFETIIAAYWLPVYKYIRLRWSKSADDAQDLTQGFFALAFEKNFFESFDPEKARFRTFLRSCLEGFLANESKAANRIKRGGEIQLLSLDFESAERGLESLDVRSDETPDSFFYREWVRSIFELAVQQLEKECLANGKQQHFQIFSRYDLNEEKLTYEALGGELNLSAAQVTNYLSYARKEFRRIVLETLQEITSDDREFRQEARALLGIHVQ